MGRVRGCGHDAYVMGGVSVQPPARSRRTGDAATVQTPTGGSGATVWVASN